MVNFDVRESPTDAPTHPTSKVHQISAADREKANALLAEHGLAFRLARNKMKEAEGLLLHPAYLV